MRWHKIILVMFLAVLGSAASAEAVDVRTSAQQYQQRQQELIAQAQQEQLVAEQQALAERRQLLKDKNALQQAVQTARTQVQQRQVEIAALKKHHSDLVAQEKKLQQEKEQRTQSLNELVGFIRMTARDADTLLRHSQINALHPERSAQLQPLLEQQRFPGMEDVRNLRTLLLDEMRANGEVQLVTLPILDRQGEQVEAQTLVLGDFSAAYHYRGDNGGGAAETGFLLYSPASSRFFALSVLPSSGVQRQLDRYLAGDSDAVPVDIGHGASLRQLTYHSDLSDQLREGGAIVWPIVAIGIIALLLIIERVWFLRRTSFDAGGLFNKLRPLILAGNWKQSESLCQQDLDKPLPRVLCTGIKYRDMERDDLENGLQEAILGEIPRLERFLSTLAVMAAIAPLLGLLGTVTGMINTFQIITFHGTSDPRLMSGGISEALITTMFGLGVAIPIMLSHSLLSRRVENIIAQLEEKSISFVNLVCQARHNDSGAK
ncbi:MAG: MotA/TolQ/ExbB proton channel family protein [Desulfuromonas sp.]|nr:MotA/TolQ/ExbB proton channel family protein [Desulfuromonas sp.]